MLMGILNIKRKTLREYYTSLSKQERDSFLQTQCQRKLILTDNGKITWGWCFPGNAFVYRGRISQYGID